MNPTAQELVDRLLRDGVQVYHGPERTFHGDPLSQEAAVRILALGRALTDIQDGLESILYNWHFQGDGETEIQDLLSITRTAIAGLDAPPAVDDPYSFDKAGSGADPAKDVVTVIAPPPADFIDAAMEAALKKIAERRHPSGDPLQFADISELRDYAVDALRIVDTWRGAVEPADSIDAAIKELPEEIISATFCPRSCSWILKSIEGGIEATATGPTPLAAMRAALERIPKQEGE